MARGRWPKPSPRGTSPCCDNSRDREPEAQVTPGKELTAVVNFVMRATIFTTVAWTALSEGPHEAL
jgi:hypothetical protein